jgi:hypothetical protein
MPSAPPTVLNEPPPPENNQSVPLRYSNVIITALSKSSRNLNLRANGYEVHRNIDMCAHTPFKDGRISTDDDDLSGQPSVGITSEIVMKVKELILQDRRLAIQDLCNTLGLSNGTCQRILSEDVRFNVFTAVTMKDAVFWDVTSCGSCKNRRFRGM